MISRKNRIVCLALCAVLLLAAISGCSSSGGDEDGQNPVHTGDDVNAGEPSGTSVGDSRFTLRYTDEDSLNPLDARIYITVL